MTRYLVKSKSFPEDDFIEPMTNSLEELIKHYNPEYYDLYQLVPALPEVRIGTVWIPKKQYKNDPGVTIIDSNAIYDSDPSDTTKRDDRYVVYRCNDLNNLYVKSYISFINYFKEVAD